MKAFIASENVRYGILLSNVLNSSGINTSQNESGYASPEAMINDLSNGIRSFDICFAISRRPIDLSMDANKVYDIRAAYCKDSSDIVNARRAGANVIVLDATNISSEGISSMVEDWLSGEGFQVRSIAKAITGLISPRGPGEVGAGSASMQSAQPQKQAKRKSAQKDFRREAYGDGKRADDEEDNDRSGPKGKGIMSRIKYALGLE
ncbi:MAG: RpiB/LacA/LacB family sugar-phosphate isomerase [Candidatus Micrarchaeia archaeon]